MRRSLSSKNLLYVESFHKFEVQRVLNDTNLFVLQFFFPVIFFAILTGDPRISSANVIWITSDSTSWERNPSRWQDGELALDVCLEKSAVKEDGDAWRNVLDCCLPIIHLIDTRRSVPYAIKQVQKLLGISCAFDQTIQVRGIYAPFCPNKVLLLKPFSVEWKSPAL